MPAFFALLAVAGWCGFAAWVWMALLRVYRHIHYHEPELGFLIASVFVVIFLGGVGYLASVISGPP